MTQTQLTGMSKPCIYEAEIKFKALPFTTRVDVSTWDMLECLKSGLYKNQAVESVSLFSIHGDEEAQIFVYNIEAAKSGQQPWSVICQAT